MNKIMQLILMASIIVFMASCKSPEPKVNQEECHCLQDTDSIPMFDKQVLEYLNQIRQYPQVFAQILKTRRELYKFDEEENKYYYQFPGSNTRYMSEEGVSAINEAIKVLETTEPMGALKMIGCLCLAARDHVEDAGISGKTGHIGSNGSIPFDRIKKYTSCAPLTGECLLYGTEDPLGVIFSLIIDDGVPDRSHRKNLLNPNFNYVGIANGYHKNYKNMVTINLYGGNLKAIYKYI